jgi:hypothetical protein
VWQYAVEGLELEVKAVHKPGSGLTCRELVGLVVCEEKAISGDEMMVAAAMVEAQGSDRSGMVHQLRCQRGWSTPMLVFQLNLFLSIRQR